MKKRIAALAAVLVLSNVGGWLWALLAFHDRPAPLGIAFVVYGLGLRHAIDADHIAAIDNVTRKLMQARQRPVAVGFFFALGHSLVVIVIASSVATASLMLNRLEGAAAIGGIIGTVISASFLFVIGAMNIAIFRSVRRTYKQVRAGELDLRDSPDLTAEGGLMSRFLRPLFGLVTKSWHMVLLGILFGIGFDTATEVAMFGISAAQAAKGLSAATFLLFPFLFTAGMSLADTADGLLMLGAYQWAYVKPLRTLRYNLTITLMSALVAFLVGSIEVLGLISGQYRSSNLFWTIVDAANANSVAFGSVVIALFLAAWMISFALIRMRDLREIMPASAFRR